MRSKTITFINVRKMVITIILSISSLASFAQFDTTDVTYEFVNISEDHKTKFISSKQEFVNLLNQYELPAELKPIKLKLINQNDEIWIAFKGAYNPNESSKYDRAHQHQKGADRYGDQTVSVYLVHEIFTVLGDYKFKTALSGFMLDVKIMNFINAATLYIDDDNWLQFYSFNQRNSAGFFPYYFYSNILVVRYGNSYELNTNNLRLLNELKYFSCENCDEIRRLLGY